MRPVPVGAYTRRISSVPLIGGQAQGLIGGTGGGTLQLLQHANNGGYVVQANEFNSGAPFSISFKPGPPYGYTIVNSSINAAFPGAPGAYPSIYVGNQYGNLSPLNPYPIKVSSIGPGAVTTTLTATLPAAGPIFDCSYDNWFNTQPNPTSNAINGMEWMIWLATGGGNLPAGTLFASGVSIGGLTYNVYFHPPWANATAGGTASFLCTSTISAISYDAYPFIQYMITQGWLNPNWYLTNMQAGFEIWSGAVAGAGINSFTVSNAPSIPNGALSLSVGPQGLGNVWYPAQATVSTTTGPLDTSTCLIYLGAQGVPTTLQATVFPGGAGTVGLAIPSMTPGQVIIANWTGGHPGDVAGLNIGGTMDALTTGAGW